MTRSARGTASCTALRAARFMPGCTEVVPLLVLAPLLSSHISSNFTARGAEPEGLPRKQGWIRIPWRSHGVLGEIWSFSLLSLPRGEWFGSERRGEEDFRLRAERADASLIHHDIFTTGRSQGSILGRARRSGIRVGSLGISPNSFWFWTGWV